MAPVHTVKSYSFSSSSSEVRSNAHGNRELSNCWERSLPFSFRGRFFEDSFFESARARYEEKVKRFLEDWTAVDTLFDEWCNTTSCATRQKSFRNLLSPNQEKQIFSVTSEDGELKILLDVREYTVEDIRVRVVGEREVEVEGHQKQKENEASNIQMTPNKFRYLISLPKEAEMDTITSAMSADGILSISVPRKKIFDKIYHHIPVEVQEPGKICLSSASDSSVSINENVSDYLSQSASKSSSNPICANVLGKDTEDSERYVYRTDVDMIDHRPSRQLGGMQESSKSILSVENLNDHKERKIYDSFGIQKTDKSSGESGSHSQLCKITIKGSDSKASKNGEKESERHISNENLCATASFMNLPITRKESLPNGNTKVTSSVSDEEYQHKSGEIYIEESATMVNHSHDTSVIEDAIETHRLNEDYLKSMKQPHELIDTMNVKTTRSAVHDAQIKETIRLQDEQPLTDEANLISSTSQCSLESSTRENEVSPAESTESSTHQSESSAQSMEAYLIQDQTMTERNSLDSSDINKNRNVFQSGSKSCKGFVKNKTTSINEQDEITEKESPLVSYEEAEAGVRSNSSISDTYKQDVQTRHSCEKNQTYSKDSLEEEYQSSENTSSSVRVGVDWTTSSRNVSRNLLIAKRGSFFTDSHFEGMQEYYLTAVRKVLSKYGDFPFACDELSFYRNLRLQDQRENVAAITFENEGKLHFILDLYTIMKEEINVEIVNEQEIVVRSDLKEMQCKEDITILFSKCLNMYGEVETSSAEAALSSEGVLVILIPKKVVHQDTSSTGETFQYIPISSSQTTDVYLKELADQNSTELSQNTESENENKFNCFSENNWLSEGLYEPGKSAVLQDGQKGTCLAFMLDNSIVESRSQGNTDDLKHQEAENKQSIRHSDVIEDSANRRGFACKDQPRVELKSYHKSQQRIQTAAHDEIASITPYEDKKDCKIKIRQLSDKVSFAREKALPEDLQVSQKAFVLDDGDHLTSEDMESFSSLHTDKSVCISVEERGLFHEDNFFTGMQNYFLKAIREILSNYYDMSATTEDEMTLYRKLINNHGPKEANLTASVSFEDEFSYKAVIDAHKFMKIRKVTLGILGDKGMEVSMEDIDEDGLGKCSSKSFAVPDGLDIYNAVAMISSDGILAVSIPKQRFLDDSAQQNKVEICKVNQSNDTRQSDTSNSTSTAHQKNFPEAIDATSLKSEVSILDSSSTVDSHILSAAKMDENVEERNSAETLNETLEEKIQMGIGYQSKSERNQGEWDQLLNIVDSSILKAEIKDDNDDNGSDEEEDFDTSTVVGVPCSLEINSLTDDESSIFTHNVNYAVTLAESPQVEPNGLLTSEISGGYKRSSKYEERNQASLAARQLLQQSSRLSIHTLDESEMECDDSWMLSSDGISRNSSTENSSVCHYDYLSSFDLSGLQENHFVNKAYSNQSSNTNFTQSASMNRYLIPPQEELNENARMFSPATATEDLSSYDIPGGHLRPTVHNMQMISGEIFGCSQTAGQENASCTTASVCKRQYNKSNCITVTKKGLFFEDTFFSDVKENFLTAMREILRKSSDEDKCKYSSDIASYKCWRKQNPSTENQAVFVCEDHHAHRVVLDIENLLEESVSIFVVDGKELLIEGQSAIIVNNLEDHCVYSRRFVLPDQVDVDAITATLSLDGILLIISPKRSLY